MKPTLKNLNDLSKASHLWWRLATCVLFIAFIGSLIFAKSDYIEFVNPVFNNSPGRSIVTTTSASGWQVSADRPVRVSYTVSTTVALTLINLNSSAIVYLEISPTNANGSWITINSGGVTRGLGVGQVINDTQNINMQGEVRAGWYVRLRSVVSGGGTATFLSGQEVTN